jgi:hypothetical protein
MKITICGSINFIDEMSALEKRLLDLGHEVKMPPQKFTDESGKEWDATDYYAYKKSQPFDDPEFLKNHTYRITNHFEKIVWCDAILVANVTKKGIENYIGANTLMEMGLAFHLGKKIFLLNPIPEMDLKEEVVGLMPTVIGGDLTKIL